MLFHLSASVKQHQLKFYLFSQENQPCTSILSRYYKTLTNQGTTDGHEELSIKVTYFLEERRIYSEVLGHDIEAEEVAVDAGPSHGEAVQELMFGSCLPEELQRVFSLTNQKRSRKINSGNYIKDGGAEIKSQQ